MSKLLKTVTLGCRVNQYETEYVRQSFERLGYRVADKGIPVDLCIVNTCTVTAEAEAKSRKIIRRLAKAHPRAKIVVMGCYAARAPEEAGGAAGGGGGVGDKRALPQLLARWGLAEPPNGIAYFPSRRRAYVKIQDGCSMRCSYCIVPTVRPHLFSRPAEEVLDEVRRLVASGHHEIVLTGIHLGHYGNDECRMMNDECETGLRSWVLGLSMSERAGTQDLRPKTQDPRSAPCPPIHHSSFIIHHSPLADLLRRITALEGNFRVRLSSIEASEVTPELVGLMAERGDRICPHLHMPLQSGSDAVLQRMNRPGPVDWFIERCREIRAALDWPSLSTDLIVGFPGETEADFAATCRAVEEIGFAKVHVFRFSPRPGTPAADMPRQVPGRVAMDRAQRLGQLGETLRQKYLDSLLGRPLRVLVETCLPDRPGWMVGTCDYHVQVALPGGKELMGQFVTTSVSSVSAFV
jgi:threonylcarbamoyladenosine tRNA methylthiotransferase MtaB